MPKEKLLFEKNIDEKDIERRLIKVIKLYKDIDKIMPGFLVFKYKKDENLIKITNNNIKKSLKNINLLLRRIV